MWQSNKGMAVNADKNKVWIKSWTSLSPSWTHDMLLYAYPIYNNITYFKDATESLGLWATWIN